MSTGNQETEIVVALRKIIRAVDLYSHQIALRSGLTGPQLATLREAAERGPLSLGALARAVQVSQATMSGILDRLERRGLVVRTRDGRDRRSVQLTVTDAGQQVLADAPSLLQDRFREELARLEPWERNMILATLQRIAAMMGADKLPATAVLLTSEFVEPPPPENPGEAC